MKVDAICVDRNGNKVAVLVDLDYVDVQSYDEVYAWCEHELYEEHRQHFDILDFHIDNYEDIYRDYMKDQEKLDDLVPFIAEEYMLDPFSGQEI